VQIVTSFLESQDGQAFSLRALSNLGIRLYTTDSVLDIAAYGESVIISAYFG
jgi:hypothetical protein